MSEHNSNTLPPPSLLEVIDELVYPEPTVLVIDENTDLNNVSKMLEKPKVRRELLGMKIFHCPEDFEAWQREEPRQIFEVIPKACAVQSSSSYQSIQVRIFVTFNAGIIE
jgi:hypothetical protein